LAQSKPPGAPVPLKHVFSHIVGNENKFEGDQGKLIPLRDLGGASVLISGFGKNYYS
jgi:hypothetical protein